MSININLCSVPEIDLTHNRQIDFANITNQNNFFNNRVRKIATVNVSPDTIEESITIYIEYKDVKNYDYLYYVDESGKRLYYFITNREKIGRNTKLYIKLDVFQTYMFNYTLQPSFVERCHVPRWIDYNTPTKEIIDEGFPISDYIVYNSEKIAKLNESYIMVSTTPLGFLKGLKDDNASTGTGGSDTGSKPSRRIPTAKGFRFLKGFEAFSPYGFNHGGESFKTAGYGVTELYQSGYYNQLKPFPCSEMKASTIYGECLKQFANGVYDALIHAGVSPIRIKANHFDAFCSFAYNCGLGALTSSYFFQEYVKDQSIKLDNRYLNYYIKDGAGNILQGLINRRKDEYEIFNNSKYSYRAISVYDAYGNITGVVTENNGHGYIPSDFQGGV